MNAAEVFTALCMAIWPGDGWPAKAADYLEVRRSTVEDWSTGRRAFSPHVFDQLKKRADHAALVIAGALGTLENYRERL